MFWHVVPETKDFAEVYVQWFSFFVQLFQEMEVLSIGCKPNCVRAKFGLTVACVQFFVAVVARVYIWPLGGMSTQVLFG